MEVPRLQRLLIATGNRFERGIPGHSVSQQRECWGLGRHSHLNTDQVTESEGSENSLSKNASKERQLKSLRLRLPGPIYIQ